MQNKVRQLIIFIGGFFLFCLDRLLKNLSLHSLTNSHLIGKIFGWYPFKNTGIAFSIPIPSFLSIALSVPILFLLFFLIIINYKKNNSILFFGLSLLFFGSLSNFIDRIFYKATIDYWLVGTGVINLADILIVTGISFIFLRKHFFHK